VNETVAPTEVKPGLIDALVSVITPVFNSEKFIEATIRSVIAQTYGQWEMLVLIDAGTRDQTAAVVERLQLEDARVRLVTVPGGRNVSDARNYGFRDARGRYVAFLDADDLWLETKLERQLTVLRDSGAPMSYSGFRRITVDGRATGREIRVPSVISYADLLKNNQIGCLTAIVDQVKTGPLVMGTDIHEDFTLWLSILKRCGAAHGVQEDLARYRLVPGSRSSRKLLMAGWRWRVYREQEKLSVPKALYFYAWYGILTLRKHLRF